MIKKATVLIATLLPFSALADISAVTNFGDSLSDSGNKHHITKHLNQFTDGKIGIRAQTPNVDGRFTNGPVWTEYLAQNLGVAAPIHAHAQETRTLVLTKDGKQEEFSYLLPAHQGTNWATGGAMSGTGYFVDIDAIKGYKALQGLDLLSNSGQQIIHRLAVKPDFEATRLVTYMSGTNNLWFTLFSDLNQTGQQAAQLALKDVKTLADAGAEHILVANIPAFIQAPWFKGKESQVTEFITQYNHELANGLNTLAVANKDLSLYFLDAHQVFAEVTEQVETKGEYLNEALNVRITDVTNEAFSYATGDVVNNPSQYLYWDGLHPSTAMHKVLAQKAAALVKRGDSL